MDVQRSDQCRIWKEIPLYQQEQHYYDRTVNYDHMERELQRLKDLTAEKVMKYWDEMEAAARLGGKDAVLPILSKAWQGW